MSIPTLLWLKGSVLWVALMSLYPNWKTADRGARRRSVRRRDPAPGWERWCQRRLAIELERWFAATPWLQGKYESINRLLKTSSEDSPEHTSDLP
jgi:hypothetical protein